MTLKPGQIQDSPNARAVAREVIDRTREGKKVRMAPIIRAHGYSESVAQKPTIVTNTAAYKDEIETYATRLEKHRDKILKAMEKKKLDEEQYRTLADAQTKVTHDVQLLTGGKTENVQVTQDHNVLIAILAEVRGDSLPAPKVYDEVAEVPNDIYDTGRKDQGESPSEAI